MKTYVRILSALFLSASCLQANEEPVIDSDLPQPLDLGFANALVTQSPFSRSVNLEEQLQLTSIAYVAGRPVATVLNKATKESVLVFEEPNALGWHLTGAVAGTDLSNTQVEMMVGPELITMHYGGQQTSPANDKGERKMSRLAAGGQSSKKESMSALLGEGGKQLYSSLSSEARHKFRDTMESVKEKKPDLTPSQSAAIAQKVFARIKEGDSGSNSKSPKPAKIAKKKQGA